MAGHKIQLFLSVVLFSLRRAMYSFIQPSVRFLFTKHSDSCSQISFVLDRPQHSLTFQSALFILKAMRRSDVVLFYSGCELIS